MKSIRSIAASAFMLLVTALPAFAAAAPVQDGAGLFSAGTVNRLDREISDFTAQTGKEIVVVTVPSLNGSTVANAAQSVFSSQDVNGILIFIAKADRRDIIVPDDATAQFFPQSTLASIRQSMESAFRDGDFDGGITTAVNGVLDVFRAHLNGAPAARAPAAGAQRAYPVASQPAYPKTRRGAHISVFVLILLVVVGFLVLRSIFRAMSGPRYYGGGPGMPGPGPGYGGYGGGYYGGGGFWSGLLGGLGGAWLGNEMFGNQGGNIMNAGGTMPMDSGGSWGGADPGGWGNAAGQADMGGASAGDFSGGGFGDAGGGFGDMGGFGGGDMGGGW